MARVFIRPRARRDLREILVYYIESADFETESRFKEAASQTFRELSEFPFRACAVKCAAGSSAMYVCGEFGDLKCT